MQKLSAMTKTKKVIGSVGGAESMKESMNFIGDACKNYQQCAARRGAARRGAARRIALRPCFARDLAHSQVLPL